MDFDEVLNLEEQFYREGFEEGSKESTKISFLEGKEYGIQTGFQKYLLIGHVKALISILQTTNIIVDAQSSPQLQSHLTQLSKLIQDLKFDNEYGNVVSNEKVMVKVRNKVRIISNLVPQMKKFNLNKIDELLGKVSGVEVVAEPSVAKLNDDGMW